ncbi:VOC family protein [Streptomyces sp. SID5785]|uniref:VOC family protein n=1 Tax=Streptomyces sp. SID5785 TaxID=2690309 RepID=UPI001361C8A1|nr:VOC family protein [Streptomyces sp. SID5785]MZD05083.1 VOC family protein [Streptomyces sp. SID5785]MZD06231.1 VOC family protein [Streptomyces sp. SID5785]
MTSIIREIQVTFDCAEPVRVARFWCEVVGYEPIVDEDGDDSWAAAADPTGAGPRMYFQRVPEGKVVKNRVHVDVRAGKGLVGQERLDVLLSEEARLQKLGATRVLLQLADDENESCLTMQDIEGNEFCLD